ncbi:unnamed protein product [Rotaria socialis]|uniref:DDE Tnp4 domain-containing protein n=1 Tax=Rotaria socialis TaxID=392032 RepID=A0A817XG23_9BILA|nr:unnamed protein product [Rotaria socialis]
MPHSYCPCGVLFSECSTDVFVPEGARCCSKHVNNHRLTTSAIDSIKPSSVQYRKLDSGDVQLIISECQSFCQIRKRLDFDNILSLPDGEYKFFTSLDKNEFDGLVSRVSKIDMRDSTNRSIRKAIATLLCKPRLGLSNRVLASLLQLPDELTVSRAIKSATSALMSTFVPLNFGFNRISRREIIEQHTSEIARDLICDGESDKPIIIVDGTYVYIQNDIIVVDRGFRDAFSTLEGFGFDIASPPFFNGRRQFTTDDANESRCITKVRWVVEAVNARLKQFKFFSNTVQNSSIPSLEDYLSIDCAIINRYRRSVKISSLDDAEISVKMQALRSKKNTFEKTGGVIVQEEILLLAAAVMLPRQLGFYPLNDGKLKIVQCHPVT